MTTASKDELLSVKELASRLKRSATYVYAMKARGFVMVANRATLAAALQWLEVHPMPRGTKRNNPENRRT